MKNIGLVSAFFYAGISAVLAVIVFLVAPASRFTVVERAGAAVWVFILANIILMPLLIPAVRKRFEKK